MKTILKTIILFMIFVACNSCLNDKKNFDNFIGTWIPISIENNTPLVLKMQIEKRGEYFLIAAKYKDLKGTRFLIGKPITDHILINISPERNSSINEIFLKNPPEMHFDYESKTILFLNTIYSNSKEQIFQISKDDTYGKKLFLMDRKRKQIVSSKVKDLYDLIPKGYFKSENELKNYITDTSRLKEMYSFMPAGAFKDEMEFVGYFGDVVDKIKILYENLLLDNYDIPNYDIFQTNMRDSIYSKGLYETLVKDNYDLSEYKSFLHDLELTP